MAYVIDVSAQTKAENVFAVGSAGLTTVGVSGENAAANHTVTAPAILVVNPAGYSKSLKLLKLQFTQVGIVAGARPEVLLGIDSGNRFTSGGTALTPVNKLAGGRTSPVAVYYYAFGGTAITAAAATAFAKYLDQREFLQTVSGVGDVYAQTFDFSGSVILPAGWMFTVGIRANNATLLQAHFNLEWLEA